MKNISLDLSKKIDPVTAELLSKINQVAKEVNADFFVIGAAARDLVLEKGLGVTVGRATVDLDLGVMVNGWSSFSKLKAKLLSTGQFEMDKKIAHRFLYKSALPLDIIPFGKIESPPGSIKWPPDREIKMNVKGFQEAFDNSLLVRVGPDLNILFVSLPGLAVLKLVAWSERSSEAASKDAYDLALLLRSYVRAGNMDRLYKEKMDLLEAEDHDQDRAGARLLGQDMSRMMTKGTRTEILRILRNNTDPKKSQKLTIAISRQLGMDRYQEAQNLLVSVVRGIEESPLPKAK